MGGAEKRFFDIFRALNDRDPNIHLVLPSCLLNIFQKENSIGSLSKNIVSINMPVWAPIKFSFLLFLDVISKSGKDDIFHYPLNPMFHLHIISGRQFTMSLCDCYEIPKLSLKSKAKSIQLMASFFAKKIDILSPDIFGKSRANYRHFKNKATLTPGGTYIYRHECLETERIRRFAFISRLEPNKGVDSFFEIVELISNKLLMLVGEPVRFDIYGEGSLDQFVIDEVKRLKNRGISIEFHGYTDVNKILSSTWVVFSLQSVTNYPSRVVAESLLRGCEVIILDTGDSRKFGNGAGINYLSSNYANLEEMIGGIFRRSSCYDLSQIKKIVDCAKLNYCSVKYIDYFSTLLRLENQDET